MGGMIESWSVMRVVDMTGFVLAVHCLHVLYLQGKRRTTLLTTGVFKYTRHPMYTGLLMMDLVYWIPRPVSSHALFYGLQTTFVLTLLAAGWFQERETLARFGAEAEEYYARTPRLILLYPLQRLFRSRTA
jgi:protein-S-isoprenylcysteine O-methyltransferase Ste14